MDYETTTVTLRMTIVQFEAVHTALQDFCHAALEGNAYATAPRAVRDKMADHARTIKGLNFTFSQPK